MPGTHCKWVQVQNGVVRQFATAMTGELHHLLLNHSLLGQQLPAQFPDEASFALGIEKGLNQPALLSGLFSARAARGVRRAGGDFGERLSLRAVDWRGGGDIQRTLSRQPRGAGW